MLVWQTPTGLVEPKWQCSFFSALHVYIIVVLTLTILFYKALGNEQRKCMAEKHASLVVMGCCTMCRNNISLTILMRMGRERVMQILQHSKDY